MNIQSKHAWLSMSTLTSLLFIAALGMASQTAWADGAALADKGGCLACHNVESRKVGPAFKDVSAKYKGQDVQAALVEKIKTGGRGNWGVLPMPPNAGKLTDEEFNEVVQWITAL
ncbi:c-type cytochrome [Methylophilus methylotrophus]|uniref:c-type cytochrome n=1 Tax=Methylophilus methylotrophus TaxID=17 RepID=UPI000362530A|nr:c-type cytochrome [Methylophilus methylotrophus]